MEANERIAVKMECAAVLLRTISTTMAKDLEIVEKKISRYVRLANLVISWRKGNAGVRIIGSSMKTIGVATSVASTLSPRFQTAMKISAMMWRLGTGLKILSYLANVLKDMWQKGFRVCLLDFLQQTSRLVTNVHLLEELVGDLRQSVHSINSQSEDNKLETPQQLSDFLSAFIPTDQHFYFHHIICLVFSSRDYSPIFDFAALITTPNYDSDTLRLLQEIESLGFMESVQHVNSRSLFITGSLLHASRELLDFLDSLSMLRNRDCHFLQQTLTTFGQESHKVSSFLLFLKNLKSIHTDFNQTRLIETIAQ